MTTPSWTWSFRVDLRLGSDSTQSYDTLGGASVNAATGNLVVAAGTHTVGTVGGSVGLTFTYNSQAPGGQGLNASYWQDANQNQVFDDWGPFALRRDTQLSFAWGAGGPVAGMSGDFWLARWSGHVTVPVAGSYLFGASHDDDGVRVWVNNSLVLDRWLDWTGGLEYGGAVSLAAGQTVPVTVEHFERSGTAGLTLYAKGAVSEQPVPASWLSASAPVLPSGWSVSADPDGDLSDEFARSTTSGVVLVDGTGAAHEYRWNGSGYVPPAGEDGVMVRNPDGTLVVHDDDGVTYTFNTDGTLAGALSPADDRRPAAPRYTYAGNPTKLTAITDGVSEATAATLVYGGGDCPGGPPPGFDATAPAGMLCEVRFSEGASTRLWYVGGFLGRVENPGGEVTDFGWDAGRLVSLRDPLGADAVAGGGGGGGPPPPPPPPPPQAGATRGPRRGRGGDGAGAEPGGATSRARLRLPAGGLRLRVSRGQARRRGLGRRRHRHHGCVPARERDVVPAERERRGCPRRRVRLRGPRRPGGGR